MRIKHFEEDGIMDSEVKYIIISVSSSGISNLILLAVVWRMKMIGEVVGKEGRADSQCNNVFALHFTGRIAIVG